MKISHGVKLLVASGSDKPELRVVISLGGGMFTTKERRYLEGVLETFMAVYTPRPELKQ